MSATLDGQKLFDEQDLKIEQGDISRDSIERTISGLDGVLSVDLGRRGRKIRQKGSLLAKSRAQMDSRISTIIAYMDGGTHTLVIGNGEEFDNVRMDSFKITGERTSGSWLCCDYEVVYTQLAV